MIRPSKLEIWVMNTDGSNKQQITDLGVAAFAPFFHPSGEKIIFSSNFGDPSGREFDLWMVDLSGENMERITFTEGFDGFPMWSPDGKTFVFCSNRNNSKARRDECIRDGVEGLRNFGFLILDFEFPAQPPGQLAGGFYFVLRISDFHPPNQEKPQITQMDAEDVRARRRAAEAAAPELRPLVVHASRVPPGRIWYPVSGISHLGGWVCCIPHS